MTPEDPLTKADREREELDRKVDEIRAQCRREWLEQGLDTP